MSSRAQACWGCMGGGSCQGPLWGPGQRIMGLALARWCCGLRWRVSNGFTIFCRASAYKSEQRCDCCCLYRGGGGAGAEACLWLSCGLLMGMWSGAL